MTDDENEYGGSVLSDDGVRAIEAGLEPSSAKATVGKLEDGRVYIALSLDDWEEAAERTRRGDDTFLRLIDRSVELARKHEEG